MRKLRGRLAFSALVALIAGVGSGELAAQHVLSEAGCANCHTTLPQKSTLRERAPDLSSAGLRYNAAWLFEFLQEPVKVRRHLGRARMPDFHLTEREALALVEFLRTQKQITGDWPELPPQIQEASAKPPRVVAEREFHGVLGSGLICLNCHTLNGKGGVLGVELGNISFRLQREWVHRYLVAPEMFGVPPATMPAQFYAVTNRQFEAIVSDAAAKIQVVADYLFSLNADKRKALEAKFERAKQSATNVTAGLGAALFAGLNCAACHRHNSIAPRTTNAAPDLAVEARRVKRPWLKEYLKKPHAIRPAGFQPGDGSRMPDFRLSDDEVGEVLAALVTGPAQPAPQVRPLTAFAQRKAGLLLADKLSCLGCHRLGEKGGRIGPDLTAVRDRLEPEYVLNIIQNPRAANPHTIMPRVPMSDELQRLVAGFLAQQNQPAVRDSYLSLSDYRPTARGPALESAEHTYAMHCAPCHGRAGTGDGFNAIYLPRKPTVHSDPEYMSRRPDDTLFDGIHSGGGILNKSHYMPPWGETFNREQIAGLVVYLRKLCQCEGPEWSRDGLRASP